MSTLNSQELAAAKKLIELALAEDFGSAGDLTGRALIADDFEGRAIFTTRQPGVIAGMPVVMAVCSLIHPRLILTPFVNDGTGVTAGSDVGMIEGPLRFLLASERTALNFLQRLSGIATLTRLFVTAIKGTNAVILDTRKTTPGWRLLEKYAVRMGGGRNHRFGLHDGILIKDNHLAALDPEAKTGPASPATVTRAVDIARKTVPEGIQIEVEVDTLEQFDAALAAGAEIVLLDNMTLDQLRECVARRNTVAPGVLLEASGGVTLATVREIAETGVDRISVGALTHSASALDIGLDIHR